MENLNLFKIYNSEEKCINLVKKWRDETGVYCKRCYGSEHIWLSTRCRYRCKNCKWETTLRSGTAMECSKLPYMYWIYAAILISHGKKPISAKELQQLLGHKYYVPIWSLLHKLRISMGLLSSLTGLAEYIKYGEVVIPVVGKSKKRKSSKVGYARVRGVKVSLEASSSQTVFQVDGTEAASGGGIGLSQIRMQAASGSMHSPTARFGKIGHIDDIEEEEEPSVSDLEVVHQADLARQLSWFQSMAFNARRNFVGVYHNISEKYFQNYLAEFCFLTNRRFLGSKKFDALMGLIVRQPWHTAQVQHSAHSVGLDIDFHKIE
jgi:hypothetical protein